MFKAIGKLFKAVWDAVASAFNCLGDVISDSNSIPSARLALERAYQRQEADKLALANLSAKRDELLTSEVNKMDSTLRSAKISYKAILDDLNEGKSTEAQAVAALRYVKACEDQKTVADEYVAKLTSMYHQGLETLRQREVQLKTAGYELDTLEIKMRLAETSHGLVSIGDCGDAIRRIKRLVAQYEALEEVRAETSKAVVDGDKTPALEQELLDQVHKDVEERKCTVRL